MELPEEIVFDDFRFRTKGRKLFHQYDGVITTFCVPWILGYGSKTPNEARRYVKHGETLNPMYYPKLHEDVRINGAVKTIENQLSMICGYDEKYIQFLDRYTFQPRDCMSGIFNIMINENLGLIARISGITMDGEYIIMDNRSYHKSDAEAEIILQSSMAVYNARRGIYLSQDHRYDSTFNEASWENMLTRIREWAV